MMKRCVYILLGAALSVPAFAETLVWQDCFSQTVSNNLDLSIARLKLKEAEAQVKSQQSVYYPEVTAKASRTAGESKTAGGNWTGTDSLSASLNAGYTIFAGFGNRARVTQAEAELYAEQANFDQTCSNIEYSLRKTFTDLLYAQELVDLLKSIAARREDNVRLVQMLFESGRENKGSLELKQAQLTESLYNVEEAKHSLKLARRRLASVMKQIHYPDFTVAGELRADKPPSDVSLEELAGLTPSYRSAEADLKAAEQGFIITRSQRFPEVTATASLTGSGESDVKTKSWQAGVAVSLPLFSGGQISQDIIISGLKQERFRLTAEKTMLDLMDSLQASFNTYRDSYAALRVQKELLQAAETRATVARAQYQQGLISFQDWDTIETALISAQRNWLSSRRSADQSEAAWQNAMGVSGIR